MKDPELNIGGVSEIQYKLDNSLRPDTSDATKKQTPKDFKADLDSSLNRIEKKQRTDSSFENGGMWSSLMSIFGQSLSTPQAYALSRSGLLDLDHKAGQNVQTGSTAETPIAITGASSSSLNTQSRSQEQSTGKTQAASNALDQLTAAKIPAAPFNGIIPMSEFINGIGKFSKIFSIESIAGQIVDAAKMMKLNGKSELSIDIKPELLGDLKLSIKAENGIISIQIFASVSAKSLLDSNLADLQQSLASANIAVGGLEVFVNNNKNGKGFEEEASSSADSNIELSQAGNSIKSFEAFDRLFYEQKLGYNTANSLFNTWG
ncbi:MAG: flagellar hook-length control protein FliK [Candidatus Margulisiibacteriota bacterium]